MGRNCRDFRRIRVRRRKQCRDRDKGTIHRKPTPPTLQPPRAPALPARQGPGSWQRSARACLHEGQIQRRHRVVSILQRGIGARHRATVSCHCRERPERISRPLRGRLTDLDGGEVHHPHLSGTAHKLDQPGQCRNLLAALVEHLLRQMLLVPDETLQVVLFEYLLALV